MSAGDQIAKEAEVFLAHRDHDYRVEIRHANSSYNWFYLRLHYKGDLIASWSCCKSFRVARWRVRRAIRQHRKLIVVANREGASL